MTLENASWCQAGFRGPTGVQESMPNTGVKTKQNKTPRPTTAILTVAEESPGTFPLGILHVPSKVVNCLLPRYFYFLCNCAIGSIQPTR